MSDELGPAAKVAKRFVDIVDCSVCKEMPAEKILGMISKFQIQPCIIFIQDVSKDISYVVIVKLDYHDALFVENQVQWTHDSCC